MASGMLQSAQPIQNVPPGIHTIPSGAGPGAGAGLMPLATAEVSAIEAPEAEDGGFAEA
jgi:hypothetical protein